MDKKSERKWRMRQLRLRSAIFFRKNGLYVTALACLAVIGIAAALLFSGGSDEPAPVAQSNDERLSEAKNATAKPTSEPQSGASASPAPLNTSSMSPDKITEPPATQDASSTVIPDFTPQPEVTADPELSKLQPPVDGSVIRVFSMNSLIYSETLRQWMTHSGVDVTAKKGDPVYAVASGTVDNVYTDDMLGVTVVIKHENGLVSAYSSLKEEPPVEIGAAVSERQIIGYIGDTAISECAERSHLHFELHYNGEAIDPESMIIFNKE